MKEFILLAGLTILSTVHGHNSLLYPCPRYSAYGQDCPQLPSGEKIDYSINSPISSATQGFSSPLCKYTTPWPTPAATWTAGQNVTVKFRPYSQGVGHGGGHCEFSISYNGKDFVVVQQQLGHCFFKSQHPSITNDYDTTEYDIKLPKDLPSSDRAIFAWSWVNAAGNREFYMNCADVAIKGSMAKTFKGKQMVVANYKGYPTIPEFNGNFETGLEHYKNAKEITIFPDSTKVLEPRKSHDTSSEGSSEDTASDGDGGNSDDTADEVDEKCDDTGETEDGNPDDTTDEADEKCDDAGETEDDTAEGSDGGTSDDTAEEGDEQCDASDNTESNNSDDTSSDNTESDDFDDQCDTDMDDEGNSSDDAKYDILLSEIHNLEDEIEDLHSMVSDLNAKPAEPSASDSNDAPPDELGGLDSIPDDSLQSGDFGPVIGSDEPGLDSSESSSETEYVKFEISSPDEGDAFFQQTPTETTDGLIHLPSDNNVFLMQQQPQPTEDSSQQQQLPSNGGGSNVLQQNQFGGNQNQILGQNQANGNV